MVKNKTKVIVLILAGGRGERFWPRSTKEKPKQLQKIYSNKTLLEETIERAKHIAPIKNIYIACSQDFQKHIQKIHPKIPNSSFILEPEARNTAPIICLASLILNKRFPDSIQIVLPADHFITPIHKFQKCIQKAIKQAENNFLVTIGISPHHPNTQYGYIETDKILNKGLRSILSFKEKPKLKIAERYIKTGKYFWNSGIFIWSSKSILREFEKHAPNTFHLLNANFENYKMLEKIFLKVKKEPIDIAIMENSKQIQMVEANFTWDDLGSWVSLERILAKDSSQNTTLSEKNAKIYTYRSKNNIISTDKGFVAILGMENVIVVRDGENILVTKKDSIDYLKKFLNEIRKNPSLQKFVD